MNQTPTAGCRKTKRTIKTELVCKCGNRLEISIPKKGWVVSLWAVALASRWAIEVDRIVEVGFKHEITALCPKCINKPRQCQCRDC